uniref:ATP synthase complex subunit 8 n=1 Tax=Callopanchax sidibeorum TaxID=2565563 RepID=A0A518QNT0_9TELE|nr:ATP synthase F0 subunit 8 [Callopanchax sidibeorum]
MPQLNPAPWFSIMVIAWLVFLMLVMPKILAHPAYNSPCTENMKKVETTSWSWPWQ